MNIRSIPFGIRAAVVAAFVFVATLSVVSTAFGVTEDFKTFFGALTAASTPLGSGDRCIVLQGGADKYIACNSFLTLNDPQTSTNKTINGASNTLTVLAGTQLSGQTPVANGGTGLSSATSGGVLCGTGSTIYAFSVALTANLPVIGGGAGACPGVGSVTGTAGNPFVVNTGGHVSGQGGSWDASGNWVNNANAVFTNVVQSFSAQQTFASTLGTQNNQGGTSYTLCVIAGQAGCAGSIDCGKTVYFTNAATIMVTLPNNAPVPCTVQLEQGGTGQITTAAASGATGPSNPRNFTKTFNQYSVITVFVDTNSGTNGHWILTGDGAS